MIIAVAVVLSLGSAFVAPRHEKAMLPADAKYPIEPVEFSSASGALIKGWLVPNQNSKAVVVLMHGVNASRKVMVNRVGFLYRAGYSLLLFDFQAHGESTGKHITFGYLESRDATAAVQFVRQKFPGQKIAVDGVSMGGAAEMLAQPPLPVDAMIVESVYPTIIQAIDDRIKMRIGPLGPLSALATPLLTVQMRPRLGFSTDDLRPIVAGARITAPKLFMAGDADRDTTVEESQAIYDAAAGPKELWIVKGAKHEDLYHYAPQVYEQKVLEFLTKYLN